MQRVLSPVDIYSLTILNANKRINSDFGLECIDWAPHHQIDAYSKSSIARCLEHYSEWSEQTLKSRFRSEDMQRHIFTLWGAATKTSEVLVQSEKIPFIRRPFILSLLRYPKLIFIYLRLIKGIDSLLIPLFFKHILVKIKLLRPVLVCFNDSELTTDEQRVDLKYYLDTLYPKQSSFEKHE